MKKSININGIMYEFDKTYRSRSTTKGQKIIIVLFVISLLGVIGGITALCFKTNYLVDVIVSGIGAVLAILFYNCMISSVNKESYPYYTIETLKDISCMLSDNGVDDKYKKEQLRKVLINRSSEKLKYDNSIKTVILVFVVPIIISKIENLGFSFILIIAIAILVGMLVSSLFNTLAIVFNKEKAVMWELICAIDEILLMEADISMPKTTCRVTNKINNENKSCKKKRNIGLNISLRY